MAKAAFEHHPDMVGRSVHDSKVIAYLRFHDADMPRQESLRQAFYGRALSGFGVAAQDASTYRLEFGEPRSRVTDRDDERIVQSVSLSDRDCDGPGSHAYPHPLPFDLRFGDDADTVTQKLGAKPMRKARSGMLPGRSPEAYVWHYGVGDLQAIVKLTETHKLCAIYLLEWDRHTRIARERKASLRSDSRNIDPAAFARIEALRAATPMPRWREAMADGADWFNEGNIAEAELLLGRYLDEVKAATARRSATGVYNATKRLVVQLNKLNAREGLIETLERDELGVFIDRVVRATGYELAAGEDVTVPWRDW